MIRLTPNRSAISRCRSPAVPRPTGNMRLPAASIAQVHKAKLVSTGEYMAVKVLRPGIERAFRKDIDAFYFAASLIELLAPSARRLRPTEVISHFEGVVMAELDLRLESASASEFAQNIAQDAGFSVPKPYWTLCSRQIMTMSWAEGANMANNAAIDSAGHNRALLGERVLQLFLSHALRDGLFHADMHQGNIFIDNNGQIVPIDFGIMGRLDKNNRKFLAEILYGFIKRDYVKVAEVHFQAGLVPQDASKEEFAQALRSVGEPIFGQTIKDISGGNLLAQLFEITEKFNMATQPSLLLLQKNMVVVEGVARKLFPETNIWEVSRPVLENWLKNIKSPKSTIDTALNTSAEIIKRIPNFPDLMDRADYALKLMAEGKLNLGISNNRSLEIEQMKLKNFRNNIIISFFGIVIICLLVF